MKTPKEGEEWKQTMKQRSIMHKVNDFEEYLFVWSLWLILVCCVHYFQKTSKSMKRRIISVGLDPCLIDTIYLRRVRIDHQEYIILQYDWRQSYCSSMWLVALPSMDTFTFKVCFGSSRQILTNFVCTWVVFLLVLRSLQIFHAYIVWNTSSSSYDMKCGFDHINVLFHDMHPSEIPTMCWHFFYHSSAPFNQTVINASFRALSAPCNCNNIQKYRWW